MKVALVHYWLVNMRGGERVLEALCELFPEADIYTHVYDRALPSDVITEHKVYTSFINGIPGAKKHYQKLLPLMPLALEQLDLSQYDLVISCESGPAKGVITRPDTVHICYCHTPMRYLWDMYHDYYAGQKGLTRWLMPWLTHRLRIWDFASAARVDHFVANSRHVAKRIGKFYRRDSMVIHPPVDTEFFSGVNEPREDFYLFVGQLVKYKRADLAVEACLQLGRKLVIVGKGEQMNALKNLIGANSKIQIIGHTSREQIRDYYARCQALLFPGEEDFGIVPVEAMAAGAPVIAYGRGGALETVVENETGVFFTEPTAASLADAIERFEGMKNDFRPDTLLSRAKCFNQTAFREQFDQFVQRVKRSRTAANDL